MTRAGFSPRFAKVGFVADILSHIPDQELQRTKPIRSSFHYPHVRLSLSSSFILYSNPLSQPFSTEKTLLPPLLVATITVRTTSGLGDHARAMSRMFCTRLKSRAGIRSGIPRPRRLKRVHVRRLCFLSLLRRCFFV